MLARRRGGHRRHNHDTAELNITAFMNLMVILVPFLLITAVFSRLAILELNLPGGAYDYEALSGKLSELKAKYPEKTDASILLESDIEYDTLVQVMDRVRVEEEAVGLSVVRNDLFPDISIGDAPVLPGA
jgi:biopolymer transport protein ExbD